MSDIILELLRGFIHKIIDDLLADYYLTFLHGEFEKMKPAIKNREDAILGYIYGWINASVASYLSQIHMKPSGKESSIVREIFQNRILEIKGRINETLT